MRKLLSLLLIGIFFIFPTTAFAQASPGHPQLSQLDMDPEKFKLIVSPDTTVNMGDYNAALVAIDCPDKTNEIKFEITGAKAYSITAKTDKNNDAFMRLHPSETFPEGLYTATAYCGAIASNSLMFQITNNQGEDEGVIELVPKTAAIKSDQNLPPGAKPREIFAEDFIVREEEAVVFLALRCNQDIEKPILFEWDRSNSFTSANKSREANLQNNDDDPTTPPVAKIEVYLHEGTNFAWFECNGSDTTAARIEVFPAIADFSAAHDVSPAPPPCSEGLDAKGQKTTDKLAIAKCTKLETGIGSFDTDVKGIVEKIFAVLLSLSGGIALLLMMQSGYQLMMSQGNPEPVKAAKERLTSAFVGFLFLLFSLVILEIIGVDILQIPGFGR